jgi:hypothetical protein
MQMFSSIYFDRRQTIYHVQITIFSRERSSTGSNDCFVVLVVVIFSLFVPCCGPVAHVVPSCGTKSRIANLKV